MTQVVPQATQAADSDTGHLPTALQEKDSSRLPSDPEILGEGPRPSPYLRGWRLRWTILSLQLGIFLATIEVSIVSTALVDMANELQAFNNGAWIINAYLVAFTGCLIVWAQFSSAIDRKLFIVAAYIVFVVFSIACAAAQTITQLIILRAIQGIGAAGVFNLSMVILSEAVTPEQFPKYSGITATVYVLAFGFGPLIGGGISSRTTWRWVFWLNAVVAPIPMVLNVVAIPNGFPQHQGQQPRPGGRIASLKRLDFLGAFLFLGLSVLFVAALQGSGIFWSWSSTTAICLLVFAALSAVLFVCWERHISLSSRSLIPVLTWKFTSRRCLGMLMSFFLVGTPTTSAIVQIPERFQIINGLSPFDAGVRSLPFIATVPFFSLLSAIAIARYKIKHAYALFIGIVFQIIGVVLFICLPATDAISNTEYGCQVLLGVGLGINNTVLVNAVPFMVDKRLIPSAMGAGMQFRYLGSAIGLGVVTAVLNNSLRVKLGTFLSSDDVIRILESSQAIGFLPLSTQSDVKAVFGECFKLEWKALLGFVCAQAPAALMML